ncbi:MAG TPA: ATP-dependent RNA helicase HrpA [Mycobacteriales bacterium]|nr:ATP-dependent RNA helicase HrpA [Mycobacteriales bacterium]
MSFSPEQLQRRALAVPRIGYPAELPVAQKKDEILAAIRDHQVVIVAGETGSGKTTQLPKICLELGRGVEAMIGHTQPRRIAARSVAERIAEELDVALGQAVGYQVRFTDRVSDTTLVKLMTDGILLAEIQRDRLLRRYDTLIIDEAHERSLNIDFILGYLAEILPRRPDLKVVITSATIDSERFAQHFGGAPVVEVSGRAYPVEVRYRPLDPDDGDQVQGILDAVDELAREGPGDVLVFLSGEREIRDTADALRGRHLRDTEILPLYSRLSAAEQHKVFQPHPGRRIVLATNVAETSLTVPGIRYVVDPGTARISRYSLRLKVQRLPIEAISRASADQRAGRCGRVADGICIRLYDEEDYERRPLYTEPEIQRTNLASVILQMAALGLGDVAAFPFVDPPDRRQIRDGVALLHELGAIDPTASDPRKRLTRLGRRLARLPVDPRFGRMVLEAEQQGCVREVLVIAAALSIQDPRERPADNQQAADQAHRRFADEHSDFLAYLNLWAYVQEQQKALSSSRFRKLCKAEHLHYLRLREWQDLHTQLRQVVKDLGIHGSGEPASPQAVHTALLAGLLSHVGVRSAERGDFDGARGARFAIFPGSVLARKQPRWVMAAELVETSRLWARVVARIEPEWIEPLAQHLVTRTYSEPHWSKKRASVVASEKVLLYGVPIVAARTVAYGRIDPELSRELFIRHALVEGDWTTQHRFFHDNRALLEEVEELEHRTRRRDIVVDDETLFAFYDARIPADVVSGRHFDAWWKQARRGDPELLTFTEDMLVADEAAVATEGYPDWWQHGDLRLALTYHFEPGAADDGVTVHIPLPVLNRVTDAGFDWNVPGLREDLVTALIRGLPKQLRRNFVPAPDVARAALQRLSPGEGALTDALGVELQRLTGVGVARGAWDWSRVPPHLRVGFRVVDDEGGVLAEGKDLPALKAALHPRLTATLAEAAGDLERAGLRSWTVGTIPRTVDVVRGGHVVTGFPSLVDAGDHVDLRVLAGAGEQRRAMWSGTRRLLQLTLPSPLSPVVGQLPRETKAALALPPYAAVPELLADCVRAALDVILLDAGGVVWDETGFERLQQAARQRLPDLTAQIVRLAADIQAAARDVDRRLSATSSLPLLPALTDLRAQRARLVYAGFVSGIGARRLPDVLRYLQAMARRLDRLPEAVDRDRDRMALVQRLEQDYDGLRAEVAAGPALTEIRWMLEELRVSVFAQPLGTAYPVSEQRIRRAMEQLRG